MKDRAAKNFKIILKCNFLTVQLYCKELDRLYMCLGVTATLILESSYKSVLPCVSLYKLLVHCSNYGVLHH